MDELFITLSKLSESPNVREYILVYQGDAFQIMYKIDALTAENKQLKETISFLEGQKVTFVDEVFKIHNELTAENERLKELLQKHVVGQCPTCNYMACWPVCTKCGTPYPDTSSALRGE